MRPARRAPTQMPPLKAWTKRCDAIGDWPEPLAEAQTQVLIEQEHAVGTDSPSAPAEVTLKGACRTPRCGTATTTGGLRIAGRADQPIHRVAHCGGAGDSLFDAVRATDAQVIFITADLRHHPPAEFRETARVDGSNIALIDCSPPVDPSGYSRRQTAYAPCSLSAASPSKQKLSALNTDPWDFTVSTGVAIVMTARQAPPQPRIRTLGREFWGWGTLEESADSSPRTHCVRARAPRPLWRGARARTPAPDLPVNRYDYQASDDGVHHTMPVMGTTCPVQFNAGHSMIRFVPVSD